MFVSAAQGLTPLLAQCAIVWDIQTHIEHMTKTTLTLSADQLLRLIDGLESVADPLQLGQSGVLRFASADLKEHNALLERLQKALNRTLNR